MLILTLAVLACLALMIPSRADAIRFVDEQLCAASDVLLDATIDGEG